MSAAKEKAQKIIDDNPVAVFSKSYCPYCRATKQLLSEMGAKYEVVELDQIGALNDGQALQSALAEMSSQRTVPNIFIGQKHIGGNSELQSRKSQLPAMLQEVGAC
ncbi:MAG: hypothetical protein LQ340_000001 [Diploschistes diacapsis]|nr:MAG: hypothetical protein LQ340_000001 [Diploschistes diacapsis]